MKNFITYIVLPFSLIVLIVMLIFLYDPEGAKREKITNILPEEIVCIVVKFDECEYIENIILNNGVKSVILTHKGNCSNPIHQVKLEK